MSSRISATLAVACALFVAVSTTKAAVYSIQPDEAASKDTFAYQFLANSSLEGGFNTILGVSKTSTGHDLISLIQFDLSSLAGVAAGNVSSAKLALQSTTNALGGGSPSGKFPVKANVFASGADWVEATTTWNNLPTTAGGVAASATVNSTTQLVEFDVTSLVKSWLDGSLANFGMRLEQDAEVLDTDTGKRVGATFVAASGAAASRPLLEITTVPEPTTGLLAGMAAVGILGAYRRRRRTQ